MTAKSEGCPLLISESVSGRVVNTKDDSVTIAVRIEITWPYVVTESDRFVSSSILTWEILPQVFSKHQNKLRLKIVEIPSKRLYAASPIRFCGALTSTT